MLNILVLLKALYRQLLGGKVFDCLVYAGDRKDTLKLCRDITELHPALIIDYLFIGYNNHRDPHIVYKIHRLKIAKYILVAFMDAITDYFNKDCRIYVYAAG